MQFMITHKIFTKKNIIWLFIFGLPLVATIIGYLVPNPFFPDKQQLRAYLDSFGVLAPVVFVAIAIIPVVVTPLNHGVFALAGGALFGLWQGLLLVWLSKTIGTIINFSLGRLFGKAVVSKLAQKSDFSKYDRIIKSDKALLIFFFMYLVPLFSNDNLSYLVGLSTISAKRFLAVVTIAHLSTCFISVYIGSGQSLLSPIFITIVVVLIIAGLFANKLIRKHNHDTTI